MNDFFLDYFDDFLTIFLNDILICFEDELKHQVQMIKILKWLQKTDLQTNVKKYEFNVRKTKYLEFIIKVDEIEVDSDKITMIENWQVLFIIKKIQFFLKFCNFYCWFIQKYSWIVWSLFRLIRKKVWFVFDEICEKTSKILKKKLLFILILMHYDSIWKIQLDMNASDNVVTAVLLQKHDDQWHSVIYFLKIMMSVECNYLIHDKEMLVIIWVMKKWHAELKELQNAFDMYTVH